MAKSAQVNTVWLQKLLKRAFYFSTPEKDGWISVREGLACTTNVRVDEERQFVRFYVWFNLPHFDENEIAAAASRLNASYFLVKFIAGRDTIGMFYELPFGEGLNPVTFFRLLRRFSKISSEAFESLPKPLADTRPVETPQHPRLH